jgi:DNA-binding Lrp family transcriptional regulator
MAALDETDKSILNRIQSNFPIEPRPFKVIGQDLGLEEDDVIKRIRRLKQEGIIRRIGGNFVPDKLGYVSTLCTARVPLDQLNEFTTIVNQYPGVTHNYQRDNEFNVWFTLIAPSMAEIEAKLAEIAAKTGVHEILNLPATNVFKIKAQFDL